MFGKNIRLFRLLGFEVRVDSSWLLLALLVLWTLAAGYFPFRYPGLPVMVYVGMAIVGALGLFLSIVVHEFAHSVVARRNGLPMKGITLFMFGGVAEMGDEPPGPGVEFKMAIAGPLTSVGLSGVFFVLYLAARSLLVPAAVGAVFGYLALINIFLAGFNMIPAFPLDGGRVLRSILWAAKRDLRQSTYTAARIGMGFGVVLAIFGVLEALRVDLIGGLWLFLIGLFLRGAAQNSYRQIEVRNILRNTPLSSFVTTNPVMVPPNITLSEFVDNYVLRYRESEFPVVEDSRLLGTFGVRHLKRVPREQWTQRTVGELVEECSERNTVPADTRPSELLAMIGPAGNGRVMVADDHHLEGVVSLNDVLRYVALKLDLDGDGTAGHPVPHAAPLSHG